jgi:hypothetical protein
MAGLFPNPSASADSYKVGDQVRWFVNERSISPYVGIVTEICPAINKVYVEFPIGGNQQKDPTELILVTPYTGKSPVIKETGYDSYDKNLSKENYGTFREQTKKMASRMAAIEFGKEFERMRLAGMASRIASNFAETVVTKLAKDTIYCIEKNMNDVQAYQSLYASYSNICSDDFIRKSISKIYESKNANTMLDMGRYDNFESYLEGLKTWLNVSELSQDRVDEERDRYNEFKKNHMGK